MAGALPIGAEADAISRLMADALSAIEVVGPDRAGQVVLRLNSLWGAVVELDLGVAGESEAADAWLAWRDQLA